MEAHTKDGDISYPRTQNPDTSGEEISETQARDDSFDKTKNTNVLNPQNRTDSELRTAADNEQNTTDDHVRTFFAKPQTSENSLESPEVDANGSISSPDAVDRSDHIDPLMSRSTDPDPAKNSDLERDLETVSFSDPEPVSGCCGVCKRCRLVQKGTNPPNYKYIGLMFAALFSSSFTLTFLFPFLPDMVKWMGYSEESKGYYVGMIASAVFAGRACGSFFWGWLSDVKGRKLVLLMTIAGNGIFSLLFGFSINLPMALIFRFLAGLANGTVGTAKTVLYEISDNTNQAFSMSAISLAWGFGIILGPTIGGYLASPAEKYPDVFSSDGFFSDFPFFLPSMVTFFVCVISFFIIFFKFEETLEKKNIEVEVPEKEPLNGETNLSKKISPSQDNVCRSLESLRSGHLASMSIENIYSGAESESFFTHEREAHDNKKTSDNSYVSQKDDTLIQRSENGEKTTSNHKESESSEKTGLLSDSDVKIFFKPEKDISTVSLDDCNWVRKENQLNKRRSVEKRHSSSIVIEVQMSPVKSDQSKSKTVSSYCSSMWHSIRHSKLLTLLAAPDIRKSVFLYTVFSFGIIGAEEVFTIFLSTDPSLNGLGFESNEIGLALGVVAIPLLVLHLIIFPFMEKKLGIKKTFMLWALVIAIAVQVLPMLYPLYNNKTMLWVLLIVILLPERIAGTCCFSATSLLINNSTLPKDAGTVNGIAMTFTALARTLAPTVGGSIYAWSVSYGAESIGPPFDHNLVFVLFGLVFIFSIVECLLIPDRLNKQNKKR